MSRAYTHTATAAAAVALLAALAGCGSSSEAAPPVLQSASPTVSPSGTATPSPAATTPPTPEEAAIAQAEKAARAYFSVMDQLSANTTADTAVLKTVAVSTGLIDAQNQISFGRGEDQRQVGNTRLASIQAKSVDLTLDLTQRPAPKVPIVQLDVCYDVSAVNVVDSTGKSVITAARKDKALAVLGMTNYDYPEPSGWKVGYQTIKGDPCPDTP